MMALADNVWYSQGHKSKLFPMSLVFSSILRLLIRFAGSVSVMYIQFHEDCQYI